MHLHKQRNEPYVLSRSWRSVRLKSRILKGLKWKDIVTGSEGKTWLLPLEGAVAFLKNKLNTNILNVLLMHQILHQCGHLHIHPML